MAKKPTITIKILIYLKEYPSSRVKDIAEAVDISYAVASAYIGRMVKDELIKKVDYGKYSTTEKGLNKISIPILLDEPLKEVSKVKAKDIQTPLFSEYNLENIDTILMLKQKYGKRKLLSIIEKIKRIIE